MTPYAHPILPLLCDTDVAREAIPGIALPTHRLQHPEDARRIGVDSEDLIKVETEIGYFVAKVWVTEGIKPGVIAMARGLGHTAYDGYLADKGVNINELIGPVEDPVSGLDAAWGIRAKLAKA